MAENDLSETGVWRNAEGELVTTQPETGVQMVAPGGPVSAEVAAEIRAARRRKAGGAETAATEGAPETAAMRSADVPKGRR